MDTPNHGGVYAIIDRLTNDVQLGLQLHKHDAVAIRTFGDIAANPKGLIALHPGDYELVRLGYLDVENNLVPERAVVITGAQWAAAQNASQDGGQ